MSIFFAHFSVVLDAFYSVYNELYVKCRTCFLCNKNINYLSYIFPFGTKFLRQEHPQSVRGRGKRPLEWKGMKQVILKHDV